MLTGPAPAARKALAKAGLDAEDIDLFEINEAFAAVAMRFMRDLGISHEITNVNGGAIAMGHPLGATGAMILGTLVAELQRRDLRRATGRASCRERVCQYVEIPVVSVSLKKKKNNPKKKK